MKIRIKNGLPYVSATLVYNSQRVTLKNVLLDTGSAGTIFSTDKIASIGLTYEPDDFVHRIRGVGGSEFVFTKRVELLSAGDLKVIQFEIEIGEMNYGFDLDGIIGLDFLAKVGALIDLESQGIAFLKEINLPANPRGAIDVKGKGEMDMWRVMGEKSRET